MRTLVYIIIAFALLSRGALLLLLWRKHRRRPDDLTMGASFALLAVSYAVYSVEADIYWAKPVETVLDLSLAVLVVFATVCAMLRELKRGSL